jgi:adenylate kinase
MAEPSAILMFGPPGSGKGTQAALLAQTFGIPHISTGDILREHVAAGDELGKEVEAILKSGKLVSDELVNRIVEERIARPDCRSGMILDGYPRTVPQAQALMPVLERLGFAVVVANLVVDYNIIVNRIAARRQCPACGQVYNLIFNPPKNDEICDRDGTPLKARADDQPEVIRKRLEAYEEQTLPVLGFVRSSGQRLVEVEGSQGSPKEIAGMLSEALGKAAPGLGRLMTK